MSTWRRLIDWIVPDWALRWEVDTSAYRRPEHVGWTERDFLARSNSITGRCPRHGTYGGSAPQCRYPINANGDWCGLPREPQR